MGRIDRYRGSYGRPFVGMDDINIDDCGPEYYEQLLEPAEPSGESRDYGGSVYGDPLEIVLRREARDETKGFKRWRLNSMEPCLYNTICQHIAESDLAWARPMREKLFLQIAFSLEEVAPDLADHLTTTQLRGAIEDVRRFLHSQQWCNR